MITGQLNFTDKRVSVSPSKLAHRTGENEKKIYKEPQQELPAAHISVPEEIY